jgi:hypothetical protein
MIQIKRFIDKIATTEAKQGRDIVLPLSDARALRDEITKLLLDNQEDLLSKQTNEVVAVEIRGERW